jgi:SAM-dependent methyltransferase
MPASPVSFEPVRDIFAAMQAEQINGVSLSDIIGGGDPEKVASEIVSVLSNYIQLPRKRSVLDVGCGCGRIATALTQYLGASADYVGVDIVPGLVAFGRRYITSRFPQFRFLLLDESNKTYDAWRGRKSVMDLTRLSDAKPKGSVDLAISVSLFTHLDYAPAVEILTAISRMLKGDGQVFVTVFVLDAEAQEGIKTGRTGFGFKHRTLSGKLHAEKVEDPTYAVAYDLKLLEELAQAAGLKLERWVRGYWSQGVAGESFQDALILRKI